MTAKHILVIDDNRDFANGLAELLRSACYDVSVAYSGEEAIGELVETNYDVILIDFMLPGMNGIEVMVKIHNLRPDARVVLMSAYDITQFADDARGHGAEATLQKPFGLDQIREVIGRPSRLIPSPTGPHLQPRPPSKKGLLK